MSEEIMGVTDEANCGMSDTTVEEAAPVINAASLAASMMSNGVAETKRPHKERKESTPTDTDDIVEQAKSVPWAIVRNLFDDVISDIISAAQSAVTSKNWSSLETIDIPVTVNENNNKYCCWECGGAKQTFGHAVIIGEPSGLKPLAISAFRKCNVPNGKQAVIPIWPSCVVAISTQSRGIGATLLYRVTGIKIKESPYVQHIRGRKDESYVEGSPIQHFVVTCQLNKVFDMATGRVRQFYNDLSHITENSDIVKAALRKATIYNCDQAIYIRPFYRVKEGYGDWDMPVLMIEDTYTEEDQISSLFTEILANLSTMIRKMEPPAAPHLGIEVFQKTEESTDNTVMMKVAILHPRKSTAWCVVLTRDLFYKHRDFFSMKSYEHLLSITEKENINDRIFISRYVGN